MEKHKKLLELPKRLWPGGHRQYEEMSVLAATGQLGGAQMYELNEHISRCASCRDFLESVAQVSVQALPLLSEGLGSSGEMPPPEGIRARFLSRVASAAKSAEAATVLEFVPSLDRQKLTVKTRKKREKEIGRDVEVGLRSTWGRRFHWAAVTIAAGLVVGFAGFFVGVTTKPLKLSVGLSPAPESRPEPAAEPTAQVAHLKEEKSELEKQLADMNQELTSAKLEQDSLANELASANAKLAEYSARTQEESAMSRAQSQEAKDQLASLQGHIERLNRRLADSDMKLAIQLQTSEELAAKLESTENELQRTRDLSAAKNEAGELVAARNLHIIDVYDADNKGNRQRSYGRVFYVEGKSLIFYAYDLQDSARLNANVVFRVWGEKAGTKETTHSLGILQNDDASQKRWAMTFDDPKVLTQINSVFVTAETGNKRYDAPRGKKILYAYFGSQANHP
jgi:hypothetical protein